MTMRCKRRSSSRSIGTAVSFADSASPALDAILRRALAFDFQWHNIVKDDYDRTPSIHEAAT
jgi:hypothetical protein